MVTVILEVILGLYAALAAISVPALGFQGLWFAAVQVISALATLVGSVVLIVPCLFHMWSAADTVGIKKQPANWKIDHWLLPINTVYGNPEDGVSGQQALVWGGGADAGKQVPYMPSTATGIKKFFYDSWRAYCWSAWRNNSDGLKYFFAWSKGKQASMTISLFGKSYKLALGWKPENGAVVPFIEKV